MKSEQLSEDCTIYFGDCVDILKEIKADAIISDPPYGINLVVGKKNGGIVPRKEIVTVVGDDTEFNPHHLLDFCNIKSNANFGINNLPQNKHTKPLVLFGANFYAKYLPLAYWICWDKSCGKGPTSSFIDAEFIWSNRRTPRNIYRYIWLGFIREGDENPNFNKRYHISQKPVELMMWLIDSCRIGVNNVVLDPYMGSASTGVAALTTGRKFIGIEIDYKSYEIAKKRLAETIESMDYKNPQFTMFDDGD